jgi:hypothetical protein
MMPVSCLPPLNPMDQAPKDGTPIMALQIQGWILDATAWDAESCSWSSTSRAGRGGTLVLRADHEYLGWWPIPDVLTEGHST